MRLRPNRLALPLQSCSSSFSLSIFQGGAEKERQKTEHENENEDEHDWEGQLLNSYPSNIFLLSISKAC